MVKKISKCATALAVFGLAMGGSCREASSDKALPISAHELVQEYENSRAALRNKYDGKEIIVRGNALASAMLPGEADNQGSLLLEDRDNKSQLPVACWFSRSQSDQFSQVRAGEFITIKGVFNGEAGVDLKFCKLIKD
jgi:hypothetical protein